MTTPIIARQDEPAIDLVIKFLPQSLLIVGEPGLDSSLIIRKITNSFPGSEILLISPETNKKQIGVNQIRELITALRTYSTAKRLIIVPSAGNMTEGAQNALLKALEEPSANTHFILATHDKSLLLPTVLSRCQTLTLHRTARSQDIALLKKTSLTDHEKQQILFLATGRPELIRQLSTRRPFFENYQQLAKDAKSIIGNQGGAQALLTTQKYATDRTKALQVIDVVLTIIKFQASTAGMTDQARATFRRAERAEKLLKANGNSKLAMLQLVV